MTGYVPQVRFSITQTSIPVSISDSPLIAANPNRKYLAWMVVDANDVTITPGDAPAVAGSGMIYQGSGAGKEGGSEEFTVGVPTDAFHCVTASGTSRVIVWEGI